MDDRTRPQPPDDGELLSAYLAGELDDAEEARLERRLMSETALRAALERQRELREALAGLRAPGPPDGARARLRERLEAERLVDPSVDAGGNGDGGAVSMAQARARRRQGRVNWAAISGVAAAVAVLAAFGAGVLGDSGFLGRTDTDVASGEADSAREFFDTDSAADELAQGDGEDAATTDLMTLEEQADEGMAAGGSTEMAQPAPEPTAEERVTAASVEPLVVDDGVVLDDEAAAREHLTGRAEALGLIGLAGEEAQQVAEAFTVALRGAEPFAGGSAPDACLADITAAAAGPVVPARVEAITYQAVPSLAYLLVSASEPDGLLDRVEAWIVEPATCSTSLYLIL